ncbi:unnamed protein product [Rhizoctonia solani]|uniref:Uncharacterized protein n=1 Tax=Rhizoctonia solani TaxID=456999 RepID=A0A8H2X3U3_9AGAM|nr:unnamed protein product [Rhizoctonia solani]CAE6520879.1 unnamed protein product [Rhizoctonia solani]
MVSEMTGQKEEDNFKWRPLFQPGASIITQGNDLRLKDPGPTWVNLFYDLAWTATFASLTQNGSFNELWARHFMLLPGDRLTSLPLGQFVICHIFHSRMVVVGIAICLYNFRFHLVCIFLQLVVFGMLAATTRAFDVTVYITHSPGTNTLDPETTEQITNPDRYQAERMTKLSIKVIAISLACSRVILFVQYLRVIVTFKSSKAVKPIQGNLCLIAAGLAISIILFFSAWGVYRSSYGRDPSRAWVKFVFWGLGLATRGNYNYHIGGRS